MKSIKKEVNVKKSVQVLTPAQTKQVSGARSSSGRSCDTNGSAGC